MIVAQNYTLNSRYNVAICSSQTFRTYSAAFPPITQSDHTNSRTKMKRMARVTVHFHLYLHRVPASRARPDVPHCISYLNEADRTSSATLSLLSSSVLCPSSPRLVREDRDQRTRRFYRPTGNGIYGYVLGYAGMDSHIPVFPATLA
jgi:GTP cyclohydrolase FolE2